MLDAKQLKIHIILINYNSWLDTIECIESIMENNTLDHLYIDVVDNASTEKINITDIKYDNVQLIRNDENLGFGIANNIGIEYSLRKNADIVILLNNDTIVEKSSLENMISTMIKYGNRKIYTGKIMYYDKPDNIWFAGGHYSFWKGTAAHIGVNMKDIGQYNEIRSINFATGCYMAFWASSFETIGFFNPNYFLYSEDLEYSLRIISRGYDILYIPDSVIFHKVSTATSKINGLFTYYCIRNRLYTIYSCNKGIKKIVAYIFSLAHIIKGVKNKQYEKKFAVIAARDFIHKRLGFKSFND